MLIANPIYDVVFKYLMDDNKVAKLIISAIIEEEIEDLEFRPKEHILKPEEEHYTVYQLDFSAKIKTPEGSKLVLIEVQKAKFYSDIMRFRKYLGGQYSDSKNIVKEPQTEYKKALPIITIYFLGHKLDHLKSTVIKVKRHYYDGITKEELKEKEEFIESLTHDSFIIQIPYLKERRRNEVEALLSVFDQDNRTKDNHILNIREEEIPAKYSSVIRRLNKAVAEEKVKNTMDFEDEIVEEFSIRERIKYKALEEKDKALEKKDKIIEGKDKKLTEQDKKLTEKDEEIKKLKKLLDDLNKKQ